MTARADISSNLTSDSWFSVKAAIGNSPAEICIYDDIGRGGATARQFSEELKAKGVLGSGSVNLRLHSGGGDVLEGFTIYNLLKGITGKVNIYIDGIAASIASVIACAPNATVHMPENAWFYLHEAWGGQVGESGDMREYADFLDRNVANMVKAYVDKTGKSEDEIRALMKKPGTWLDAHEAIKLGFADVLTPPLEAAASLSPNRQKEFFNMPEQAKVLITPKAQVTPPNANNDRVNGINDVFAFAGGRFADVQASCIADANCTIDQAKDKLLIAMGKNATPSGNISYNGGYVDNGNIVGDSVKQALSARIGLEKIEKDNPYKVSNLFDMAKASLVDRGVSISSMGNRSQVVGLAFTHSTSDFGNVLLDVANKSLLLGWEDSGETFDKWTSKGQLNDFRESHRVGLHGFKSLQKVEEGAEYKYITTNDYAGEPIALATYGNLFSITRQAIINDDLGVLSTIPQKMGRAAKRTIADLVYAVLINNQKLSDKKPLFDASHANLIEGSLSVDSLSAGRLAMRIQEDGSGNTLNIAPAHLLVPAALETTATTVLKSTSIEGASNSGIINPVNGMLNIITEARFDKHDKAAFYLAATGQTIEVAYLDGIDVPYIETQQGFSVDGVVTKVRIDAGVAPLDYRGLVKSTGIDPDPEQPA